jgi:hypothetical protein
MWSLINGHSFLNEEFSLLERNNQNLNGGKIISPTPLSLEIKSKVLLKHIIYHMEISQWNPFAQLIYANKTFLKILKHEGEENILLPRISPRGHQKALVWDESTYGEDPWPTVNCGPGPWVNDLALGLKCFQLQSSRSSPQLGKVW